MTDALNGRGLLTAALAFLLVLSVLAGIGAYVSTIYSSCDPAGPGSFFADAQAYHSDEGCELAGTAYSR